MGRFIQAVGWLIVVASIILGIYIQTSLQGPFGSESHQIRALYAIEALVPFAIGVLVVAAGHLVLLRESESGSLTRNRVTEWLASERPTHS